MQEKELELKKREKEVKLKEREVVNTERMLMTELREDCEQGKKEKWSKHEGRWTKGQLLGINDCTLPCAKGCKVP